MDYQPKKLQIEILFFLLTSFANKESNKGLWLDPIVGRPKVYASKKHNRHLILQMILSSFSLTNRALSLLLAYVNAHPLHSTSMREQAFKHSQNATKQQWSTVRPLAFSQW